MAETEKFSKAELIHLKATLPKGVENRLDPVWTRAFAHHNSATNQQLGMICRPCYEKVYNFIDFVSKL
jgi:hypothetical protein